MTLRGILFDAAGTLFELRESVGVTYSRFAAARGVELPPWRLQDAFARVVARAAPMVFPDAADDEIPGLERAWWADIVRSTFLAADSTVLFDDAATFFGDLFEHYSGDAAWVLRAGAGEGLTGLRESGAQLGIASNFDHRLPHILQVLAINHFFESITVPSRCRLRKPAAGFYTAAAAAMRLSPSELLYVGDGDGGDIDGARRAGLDAVAIGEVSGFAELPAWVAHR